ncbi:hypothetical protein LV716_13850 [Flagellimonas sp. HMM57]|uniref:hypothetical protein n=1 Tax=unclassified Flagellimonas TaxID=2644544 RepID=UPI0013D6A1AE|nr:MULTISPECIES: hypothetical protein [unclassified Flagellimonas]UII75331.1 hypothetical protein LV716_13850 [Flagellimonas sp. HMM57]
MKRGVKRVTQGKQCSCDAIESVADAFERPDFLPRQGKGKRKRSKSSGSTVKRERKARAGNTSGIAAIDLPHGFATPNLGNILFPRPSIPMFQGREIATRLTVPTRINFSGNDGTVLDRNDNVNNRTLNAIVKTLQDYPQLKMFMYVNFLTDIKAKGSFDKDRHRGLVSKRAAAIIKFFENQGIDPERINWDFDPKRFETRRRPDNTIRDDQKFELRNNN